MRNQFRHRLLGGLLLLLVSVPLQADTGVEQMNRFLQGLESLQASFEQSVLDPERQSATRSQGIFYLQRPDKFRWDYFEPESQQIIADGSQIWLYDPELEQVSVQRQQSALRGTPALLLISGASVTEHFEVVDIGSRQGFDWVELIPRDPESQFVQILLAFTGNELRRMEMADKFGQVSRFQFYNYTHNPVFESGFFVFEPPENTDVYNQ